MSHDAAHIITRIDAYATFRNAPGVTDAEMHDKLASFGLTCFECNPGSHKAFAGGSVVRHPSGEI